MYTRISHTHRRRSRALSSSHAPNLPPPSADPHSQVDEIDDGNRSVGKKRGGKWHGVVTRFAADGKVDITHYEDGQDVGDSAQWSTDRAKAWKFVGGEGVGDISLDEAAAIAKTYGLDVPPPRVMVRTHHAQPHA